MPKRIIIAGGGTGGHIFPAIAIANALKRIDPQTEFMFVGAKGRMEMEKVPKAGFRISGIDIAGFNRSSLIKNLWLPVLLIKSFLQVRKIIRRFKPDAVIGVGGYSSYPVLRFAQMRGVPTFIHESNSFAGKSNKMLGKRASKIFVASDRMERFFPEKKIMITGNPVRKEIVAAASINHDEALSFFGLKPGKKTVFVVGGSLGAKSINEAIAASIDKFAENNLQLIWQTGTLCEDEAKKISTGKQNIWTSAFIPKIEKAYAAADVVISRSGAMAVTELCLAGKPVIFVPYPHAAEDHQTVNAESLVMKQAAVLVKDKDVKDKLFKCLLDVVNSDVKKETLSKNISALKVSDADERIAQAIIQILDKK